MLNVMQGGDTMSGVINYSKPIKSDLEGKNALKKYIQIYLAPRKKYDRKREAKKALKELRKLGI